ncbi:MAG: DUF1175 family protein [Acidobacteria bacterium]|nr:DUF1175 family protein [Acidobacteriota bacterium]
MVVAAARLVDESDRAAFRAWFVFLADAQFYRTTDDVTDCAALVRHAYREALRAHTPEWVRRARLPLAPAFPDVRHPPAPGPSLWPLFRVARGPHSPYAEFADARTLVRFNTRFVAREAQAARPGDLLYFRQPDQRSPDHLMVFVGRSMFEREADDWIVYHTGPLDAGEAASRATSAVRGEVRKIRLTDLLDHPSPRWRPTRRNPRFVGVFRLAL